RILRSHNAPTPRSPQTKVPFAQTRLRRARKTVRLEPPMSPSMEARIAEYAAAPDTTQTIREDIPEGRVLQETEPFETDESAATPPSPPAGRTTA
ncbi:hypothetical protein Tco_1058773, partial [Tanacetum coccineum]